MTPIERKEKKPGCDIYDRCYKVDKSKLLQAISDNRGNILSSAEFLGIAANTIYDYMAADEDVEMAVYNARRGIVINRCDVYESRIHNIIMDEAYPSVSLNGAKYYLETHAKQRGYGQQMGVESEEMKKKEKTMDELFAQLKEIQEERKIKDISVNAETKS